MPPTRLVSSRNITSTGSEENSADSTFRTSLSSRTVKSSAFRSDTTLPDFASMTVTDMRLAAKPGKALAHSATAQAMPLLLDTNLRSGIEPRHLRRSDLLAFLDARSNLGIRSEPVADLDILRFDDAIFDD